MFYTVVWLVMFSSFVFCLMDSMDMPFMEVFDTDIPFNAVFYVLFYVLFVLSIETIRSLSGTKKE